MRHETHTRLSRGEVFEAAVRFFGEGAGGLGMKMSARQGNQIAFFGGGQVWVTVWPATQGAKEIRVDLDVSERDAEARSFIRDVLKAAPSPTESRRPGA